MKKILPALALLLLLAACGDATKLTPVNYQALDGWSSDQHAAAFKLFADSCEMNLKRKNAYLSKAEGPIGVRQNWSRTCSMAFTLDQPDDATARQFFESNFTPYKVETEATDKGVLTGYYEPIINGSLTKKAPYLTPVYGVPPDLKKPYFTREEIVGGALRGKAPVLLYVDDPVMLFFLHIQGSGKVRLTNGKLVGLQYAAQNGHPFFAIGKYLKETGDVPKPSMQSLRDWLRANPARTNEVMNMNPSYIFFKLSPGDEMAKGALGIPLTPLRSVAVDDDRATYGVPTFIDTYMTVYPDGAQAPLKRLFVSQDTGGALHGPHRGDLFFGRGEHEEWQAGHQYAKGNVYWLLPVADGVKLKDGLPLKEEESPEEINSPAAPWLQIEEAPPVSRDEIPPAEETSEPAAQ